MTSSKVARPLVTRLSYVFLCFIADFSSLRHNLHTAFFPGVAVSSIHLVVFSVPVRPHNTLFRLSNRASPMIPERHRPTAIWAPRCDHVIMSAQHILLNHRLASSLTSHSPGVLPPSRRICPTSPWTSLPELGCGLAVRVPGPVHPQTVGIECIGLEIVATKHTIIEVEI